MRTFPAAIALAAALVTPALAQGDAGFCGRYAVNMAGVGDLAVKKNPACLDYSKGVHGSYQSHFDWCMKQAPASVQGAEANIRRLVTQCTGNGPQPAGTGQPVRPNPGGTQARDTSRVPVCTSFGKAAANWENRAMGQGCTLSFSGQTMFNGNEGTAFNWCMQTSDESFRGRSPQALGHKGNLERLCGAQLRRPVKL